MIALFIVAHGNLGESLMESAQHVLGMEMPALEALDLTACEDPEQMLALAQATLDTMDANDGVLLLTDVYGATPCNTVTRLLRPGRVEALTGVNLPMLLKALSYRNLPLAEVMTKAMEGGREGIVAMSGDVCG